MLCGSCSSHSQCFSEIVAKYREEVCGIMIGDTSEHPLATPVILKLTNNSLEDITQLDKVLELICDLSKVTTLDLSFNKITTIEGAFDGFPSLKRLYLHGNAELASFAEALHLQTDCPHVRAQALHCWPMHPCTPFHLPTVDTLDTAWHCLAGEGQLPQLHHCHSAVGKEPGLFVGDSAGY